jgi:hypothetical protein
VLPEPIIHQQDDKVLSCDRPGLHTRS